HQVSELARSRLKSTLDVGFADVLASEAELAAVRAESTVRRARSRLAASMGLETMLERPLADDTLPLPLAPTPEPLVDEAMRHRADVRVLDAQHSAAQAYADAQKRLRYPALSVMAVAGEIPYHDPALHNNYAAAGFNLNLPIFSGGLLEARRAGASLEAQALGKDVAAQRVEVAAEVRDAWYQAYDAFRSLDVSARLVEQSTHALRLAQTRYDNGLGTIVELNEAQLNETS